jgi:virB6 protein
MERIKIKIVVGFGVFAVFFLSAIVLLVTNFVVRMSVASVMSNMNYITDIPIVVEPILVILSFICFILSAVALVYSLSFLKEQLKQEKNS